MYLSVFWISLYAGSAWRERPRHHWRLNKFSLLISYYLKAMASICSHRVSLSFKWLFLWLVLGSGFIPHCLTDWYPLLRHRRRVGMWTVCQAGVRKFGSIWLIGSRALVKCLFAENDWRALLVYSRGWMAWSEDTKSYFRSQVLFTKLKNHKASQYLCHALILFASTPSVISSSHISTLLWSQMS